MDLWNQI